MATEIEFEAGNEMLTAYISTRTRDSKSPGIVLMPAIAGINDYVLGKADKLSEAGYTTLVLDYYAREGAAPDVSTPQKIGDAVAMLSDPRTLSDIKFAIDYLRTRAEVDEDNIASFGFCIGGMYALLAACEDNQLRAAVDYYGAIVYGNTNANKPNSPLEMVPILNAPLLAHFGDFDRLISSADIDTFKNKLQEHQKPYEMYIYGGAPHAFDEDFRPSVYRPVASADAWRRTLAFLDWHLKNNPHF